MRRDPQKRFIWFFDGSYGLAGKKYGNKRICEGHCVDKRMEVGLARLERFVSENGRLPKSADKKDGYKLYQWLISTKSKPQRLTDDPKKRFYAVLNRVGLLA